MHRYAGGRAKGARSQGGIQAGQSHVHMSHKREDLTACPKAEGGSRLRKDWLTPSSGMLLKLPNRRSCSRSEALLLIMAASSQLRPFDW